MFQIHLYAILLIWIYQEIPVKAEYRMKMRGPYAPPRPPPMPHYVKKWHHQHPHVMKHPNGPPRMRPMPGHLNLKLQGNFQQVKKPIPPPVQIKHTAVPLQNVWKQQNNLRIVPEKTSYPVKILPKQEYDYHIQTNNIPNHLNTIKQIDEKGPIHTIPAPKLSPADKPKIIQEIKPQHQDNIRTIVHIQKTNQYQVTEPSDIGQKPLFYPQENLEVNKYPTKEKSNSQQLSNQEIYKLVNTYPQQQLLDTYALPLVEQPQLQQHMVQQQSPTFQALVSSPDIFEQQISYMTQVQHLLNSNENKPSFSFNKKENSYPVEGASHVSAEYTLDPQAFGSVHNSADALAQAQYVQRYFDTRDGNLVNNIEPDARPSAQITFDSGQESKQSLDKEPMQIYVPDEEDSTNSELETETDDKETSNLDETNKGYEVVEDAGNYQSQSFGTKLKPKNN